MLKGTIAKERLSARLEIMPFKSSWKFDGKIPLRSSSNSVTKLGERKERAKVKAATSGKALTTM